MENSDSVAEDGPMEAKGTAASKAIRRNFPKLSKAVTRGDILEELYAQELIDQQTFEIYTNPSLTDRDKGRKILLEVQSTVEIQPDHFDTFCSILDDESDVTKDLSKRLRESYEKILEASQKKEKAESPTIETEEFKKLKNELEVYRKALAKAGAPEEALFTCIKESIRQYVEDMLETDESVASLQKQMSLLCYKHLLIPSKLTEWVSRVVETISSDRSPAQAVVNPKPQVHEQTKPQEPPLFNKDTVYHASLCCHAVSTRHAGNFKHYFDHIVRRHCLEEVSMSVSKDKENVDRYLIAKQLNTIYIAFQSEATISQWMDEYTSFDDGLEKQRERIPVRFLEELLLWDQKRIVLTGFSFGGMLACSVAANIWKRSQINTGVLKDRVICINFGQPLINMPFVQEVIKDFQQFETTIYSMFTKEDVIPGLLRFFAVGCMHYRGGSNSPMKALTAANGTKVADKPLQPVITLPTDGPKVDFKARFAAVFLKNLASLQDSVRPEHTYSGAVSKLNAITEKALGDLKEALHQVIPYAEVDPDAVLGNCYLTVSEEGHGITSKPVSKKMVAYELGFLTVENLETSLFKKHNMEEYRQSLLRGFLEKSLPNYSLPDPAAGPVKEVGFLKPNVNTVEVHKYPDEVAVVLEGDNLWFCHQIRLGDYIPQIPKLAEHIARRSIQFNFCLSKQTAKIVADDGYVKVTLFSHFAHPIRRKVKAELEPEHSISLRQMQLAKHTPSEVIELAYLGAMLECHSQHEVQLTTSKRFKEVARFLEEAVQVVPLESVFFAIAYSDDDSNTALECAKALMKSQLQPPPSEMMVIGSQKAAFRMRTGIRPEVLDQCTARALSELSARLPSFSPLPVKPQKSYPKPTYQTYRTSPKPSYSDITRRSAPAAASQVLLPTEAFLIPVPTFQVSVDINVKNLPPGSHGRAFPEVADSMEKLAQKTYERAVAKGNTLDVVCKHNIEHIYPADAYRRHTMHGTLQSPLDILKDARKQLASYVDELQQNSDTGATVCTQTTNEQMLEFVREIRENNLKICAALLGSFMEQQIHIPLLNSPMDTAKVISSRSSPVAVGVWALFSMSHLDLQKMLSSTQGNSLTVEIADYMAGIFDPKLNHPETKRTKQSDSKYAGKLQFMLQGIKKTVSCSTQYISYSLERQLCNNPKVNESIKSIKVQDLTDNWDKIFKGDALSLVAKSHRPLIARWMKWAILVHDLREALASYMCVGVIGLINSGKSQLVNTLFKVQAQVGTIRSKRTTVPLLYNLDGKVDGLDVIDFPGVDDKDQSIPQLANLLLGLVQAVIFVVDRGKFSSGQVAIEQWLCELKAKDVPVLLCLTHADRLYAECINHDGTLEPTAYKQKTIDADLTEKRNEIGHHPSWAVHHYCFHLPEDSQLKHEHLKEVGIGFPKDVGEWIVKTFRQKLDQNILADRLQNFLHK